MARYHLYRSCVIHGREKGRKLLRCRKTLWDLQSSLESEDAFPSLKKRVGLYNKKNELELPGYVFCHDNQTTAATNNDDSGDNNDDNVGNYSNGNENNYNKSTSEHNTDFNNDKISDANTMNDDNIQW